MTRPAAAASPLPLPPHRGRSRRRCRRPPPSPAPHSPGTRRGVGAGRLRAPGAGRSFARRGGEEAGTAVGGSRARARLLPVPSGLSAAQPGLSRSPRPPWGLPGAGFGRVSGCSRGEECGSADGCARDARRRSVPGSELRDVRGSRAVQGLRDAPEELRVGWGGAAGEKRAPKSFCPASGPQLRPLQLLPLCLPFPGAQLVDKTVLGELLGEHEMDSPVCVMRELRRLPGRGKSRQREGSCPLTRDRAGAARLPVPCPLRPPGQAAKSLLLQGNL